MVIPSSPSPVPAGVYPPQLVAACEVCQVAPGMLLAWAVKNDELVLILPTGQKVKFLVIGKWINPPLPFMDERPSAVDHLPPVGSFDLPPKFEDGGLPPDVPLFEDGGIPPARNDPPAPEPAAMAQAKRPAGRKK